MNDRTALFKIDLHTHILPSAWPDLRSATATAASSASSTMAPVARMMVDDRLFRGVASNCWSPADRLADCDRHSVHVQVLSTVPVMFSYWARPQDTHDLARFLNDHIAEVVRTHPRRFVGLGTVPLQDTALAIRELERCVKELGLRGVEIGTNVNDQNLDYPDLFPFFQAAQDLDAAVFVHPWEVLGKERLGNYFLAWLVGMPAETALAICSLIFGGVLERLPRLRVCFAHGGGSFAGTIGRIERGFHARPDLCARDNAHNPRRYLGRFYVDSLVHDADALRHLIRLMGAERIALGSDYPFPLGETEPGRLIESLTDLPEPTRQRLLAGTALEFLGLDPKAAGGLFPCGDNRKSGPNS